MKSKREAVNYIKNFQNNDGVSRYYFNEIRKNKNFGKSINKHIQNSSIFLEPVYKKRKAELLNQQRFSITQNNSPNNNLKKINNLKSKYSGESFHHKKKSPLKNQNDSDSLISTCEYKSKNELLKQNSEIKKSNYKNKIEVNNIPNNNIIIDINDSNGSLNSGNYVDESHSLTEYKDEYKNIKKYIDHKLEKEIKKLKNNKKEEDINLVKEEYNKLKKEYDHLKETHLKLINEYNIMKNRNRKLNYERFEISRNLDEIYNSQTPNDNIDILCATIDNLEEENNALKNKLKNASSFLQNEKITHFQLCFISEVTKKGEDNYIKIKKYHTPDKYNKNENHFKRFIEINNNENFKKLKDNYNDLNEKYNYLKNEFIKIMNEFNSIKKQENTTNLNFEKSFCILNQASENITDVCNFSFKDINQNEELKCSLEKKIVNYPSNFYANSIIQCLVNVNKLFIYFLNDFPKNSLGLKKKNSKNIKILNSFHSLIEDISKNKDNFSYNNSETLNNFKEVISEYNPKIFDLNCKDFLLNLLQIFHDEFNYLDNKIIFRTKSYNNLNDFNKDYNIKNSSIISDLFFGTFEYKRQCKLCQNITFSFEKFKFLSFGICKQYKNEFNIYNGFEDNEKAKSLSYQCNNCRRFCEFECSYKIIEPPKELLININYSRFKPSKINFDNKIDITKFVNSDFGTSNEYRINCVCSKTESNYITYCWNRDNEKWYIFDNSSFKECDEKDIYLGDPYLLLYEKI